MNRTQLVEDVARRAGSDPAAARRHVDAVLDAIMESVAAGERVLVTGFGTFDRTSRPARTARNPRTGQPVAVPAAELPRFRVGQTFKNRVAAAAAAAEVAAVAEAAAEPKKAKKGKKKPAKAERPAKPAKGKAGKGKGKKKAAGK
ncbi:HU family DNA-binding protein [Actinomadura parmotrematis]|uniref:HU family DNA-binding protein n=1 Tax=Actinomadura parmotrematis TaxID=2864039 RepID=A0ABS7G3R0_9ACTN|nr:HU family DNA-binding protein [Actinomadura parmotrematis]MBW8486489.1 HU family DNA-binding protein [Actinomadura parmotrematis]